LSDVDEQTPQKKKAQRKTGMSGEADLGAADCISSDSGRHFLAHILKESYFHEMVADVNQLIAQGVALDLFDSLTTVDRTNAMKLFDEHFAGGGKQDG
jgi:hypothetical protein